MDSPGLPRENLPAEMVAQRTLPIVIVQSHMKTNRFAVLWIHESGLLDLECIGVGSARHSGARRWRARDVRNSPRRAPE
jgi:hypothetical protein